MKYAIFSTIDNSILSCNGEVCFSKCKDRPQVKEKWFLKKCPKNGWCCYEVNQNKITFLNISPKIKKQCVRAYFNAFIDCISSSICNKESNNIEKNTNDIIVHNSKNIHANIVSKFQNIFPELDEQKDKFVYIQNKLTDTSNAKHISRELLSIWKSLNQQTFQYSVTDYIETSQLAISDFLKHKIYTILQMAFFQYEDDFKEKRIYFNLAEYTGEIYCHFDTVKAGFCALLENCLKYCRAGTSIDIDFGQQNQKTLVKITMDSRFIEASEITDIFNYGKRGKHVSDLPGKGIGLWIIKKMMELNYGDFHIAPSTKQYEFENSQYGCNVFTFTFNQERRQILDALN